MILLLKILWIYLFLYILGVVLSPYLGDAIKSHVALRTIGWVFITYVSYLTAHFIPFLYASLFFLIPIVILIAIRPPSGKDVKVSLIPEILFATSFVAFLFIRYSDPSIFGAEKFMDIAFIHSILRSESFPPPDPWFAGGNLNFYYYFGYVMVSQLIRIGGLTPETGFNVILPLLFSLTIILAYEIGEMLSGSRWYGVLSAYFVGIAGNLAGFIHIIYNILNSIPFDYTFYWASSRVIPETINEFPFFSFLHGDLHAHVIAIPLKLFFLLVLVSLWKHGRTVVHYTLLSFLMAVFIMTNTWDFVGMGLTLLIFLLFFEPWKKAMISGGLISIASLGLALPFLISFEGGSDFGFVTEASPVLPFLAIYLPFFVPAFLYGRKSVKKTVLFISLLAGSVLFILGYQIFIVVLPLLLLMFPGKTHSKQDKFVRTLFFSGLILLSGVEVIYLDSRLNSVFKLYLQIWVLFALSVPYMLHKILPEIRKSEMKPVYWIMIALIAMTAFYPPVATYTKALSYPMYTLNGADFIKDSYPEDYLAIQWLENYAHGTILEYASPSYEYGGRISSFTGLPTVIAWYNHEVFWRKNSEEIIERINDVKTIYGSDNATLVRELARKYNISYLYIGNLEFENYSVNFSTLSSAGFELIKTFGNSSIYKFSPEG